MKVGFLFIELTYSFNRPYHFHGNRESIDQKLQFIISLNTFYQTYADSLFSRAGRKLIVQTRQKESYGRREECITMNL